MKTNKLILSILTGTLILTSATALLDNSHFVEAKRQNNRTKVVQSQEKKVIKREYLSKDETKKIIDTMLNDGIITKEKLQELYSMLEDRSFGGWFWVEYFSDGAKIYQDCWVKKFVTKKSKETNIIESFNFYCRNFNPCLRRKTVC